MILGFIICILFVMAYWAIGTSHENKSPMDRFGDIVRGHTLEDEKKMKEEKKVEEKKVEEKKEHKRGRARKVAIYAHKYPMLDRIWKRCSMEEKEKINEAITIIYDKKMDILEEEGKLKTLEEREKE